MCAVLLASAAPAEEPAALRPGVKRTPLNIVLIMAEDLSPRIGAYGDPVAHTPHIDRLAREGTRYTRAFTSAGVCAASRSGIIMGVHQNTWGAGHMRQIMTKGDAIEAYTAVPPAHMKAFPEQLRAAGYYTVNAGKTDYQMELGLSGALSGGPSSIWDENSSGDWSGREEGQPFFAYLNLQETHESQVWPTWSLGSIVSLIMMPGRVMNHWNWPLETSPDRVVVPAYYPDTPTVRADIARHYNNIAHMDERVGEILAKLEAEDVADRTVVLYTTDHGDGLPRAKRWLYDSGIHVPLVVRWPGVAEPGRVNEELVSGIDFAPTILAMAGVAVPDWVQGRVFVGRSAAPEPAYVYAARDRMDESPDTVRAVRDRRFKYIRNLHPDRPYVLPIAFRDQMPMMAEMHELAAAGELDAVQSLWFREARDLEELYDTQLDPQELLNLAADPAHQTRLATMRAELDRWLVASVDLGLLPETEQRARHWPSGERPATPAPRLEPSIDSSGARMFAHSATEGASIEVRVDGGRWRLYSGPLRVRSGEQVEARAVRYGWTGSEVVSRRAP